MGAQGAQPLKTRRFPARAAEVLPELEFEVVALGAGIWTVLAAATLREGFEIDAAAIGQLQPGERCASCLRRTPSFGPVGPDPRA